MASIIKIDIEGMEDLALFPYFEAIAPKFSKLIVMEDSINTRLTIFDWLLANGYPCAERTRGNVILALNK